MRRLSLYHDDRDPELVDRIRTFDTRRYVVRNLVPRGFEGFFQDQARYLSAHTTAVIEGNPVAWERAVQLLLEGFESNRPEEIEVRNTEVAYELIGQLASDESLRIDQGLIRSLNSLVLRGLPGRAAQRRGQYRRGPATIVDEHSRTARYRAPPAEWVPQLMAGLEDDLQQWLARDHPVVAAAKAHFALVSVHPFEDGNGRTARLVADLVLDKAGWSIDRMVSTSRVLLERRASYYRVLHDVQGEEFAGQVDITAFVKFHSGALVRAADHLERTAVRLNRLIDSAADRLRGALNPRQSLAMVFMLEVESLSTSMYARLAECSQSTALSDLGEMVEQGIAVRSGAGRSTRYRLSPPVVEAATGGRSTREQDA